MKVLQISQYFAPRVGGVEKHLEKINQELLKKGHKITVLAGNQNNNLAKTEIIDQVKVYRIDNRYRPNYKLKIWKQIITHKQLFKKAEIIHLHDVFWWIIPLYPFIFHKLFITFHGYESGDGPTMKAIFWHRLANRLCQGSIAVGGFHAKYYGIKADKVIYGASEIEKLSKPKPTSKKIIYVGRLVSELGILTYLQALKYLKKQGKNYSLDVYGDGPLLNKAKHFAKQAQLQVTFHGTVANAEALFEHYPIAFVSSYLSICEALKQNCQVIAHYHNQFTRDYLSLSIFKDYIYMTNDAQKIAQAIIKASQQKKLDQKTSKILTWSSIAQIYQDLWPKK